MHNENSFLFIVDSDVNQKLIVFLLFATILET